jgi:hypothetical protein
LFNTLLTQLQPLLPAPPPANLDLRVRWNALRVKAAATFAGLGVALETLAQPKFTGKALAFVTALAMFENAGPNEAQGRKVAIALGDSKFGDGLQKFNGTTLAANLDALTRALAAAPKIVEFDQLLQTSAANKVTIAVTKLTPLLANAPAFATQIGAWVDAKVIT